MNLGQTAASLVDQFPTREQASFQKQHQMLERFGQIAFGGFAVVVLAGVAAILYLIFTKLILTGDNFWGGILLLAFVLFAGLALAYVFLNESQNEKRKKVAPRSSGMEIDRTDTAPLLEEGRFEPAVSVVEDTTELLVTDKPTRKL